jgi:hypothetical protein
MFHPYEYAGPLRIPPPKFQVRVRKEHQSRDAINARQFEGWTSDQPIDQGKFVLNSAGELRNTQEGLSRTPAYDMAPLSSRTDKRDYRQAQPFVAKGPSLAMNPYFDRYDPTRDPRNAIRELRGVVYEDKEADRGLEESLRLAARFSQTRWAEDDAAEKEVTSALSAYERMKPVLNNMTVDYRLGPVTANGASGPALTPGQQQAMGGKNVVIEGP